MKYHKDNGNLTLLLSSGVYDSLPQMESDISFVGTEEKTNAVRLNADLLMKEKRFELIPLCINWARIFYRIVVHIMQYVLMTIFVLAFKNQSWITFCYPSTTGSVEASGACG